MLSSYFRSIIRHIVRQRSFSAIIVSGLTVGITASLLLVLYIQDEWSFDRFHQDADLIYRITLTGNLKGTPVNTVKVGFPVAPNLQKEIPEITSFCRLTAWKSFPIQYEKYGSTEDYLLLADAQFFTFFSFSLKIGDKQNVLRGAHKVVISESAARRIFNYRGPEDPSPIGKVIKLAQGYEATVSGIAEDAPSNSHFKYSIILSIDSWDELYQKDEWISEDVYTYFKIKPDVSFNTFINRFKSVTQVKLAEEVKRYNVTVENLRARGNHLAFNVQPLTSIHWHSAFPTEIEENGSAQQIYLFSAIAIFIILLACINFVNLSTARANSRAKEVGIRKTIGAGNKELVLHFLIESYAYTLLSLLFALALVSAAIVPLNILTGKMLSLSALINPIFVSSILLFLLLTGLLSGTYPAFFLSYLSPANILKGNVAKGITTYKIRNTLVSFQFGVTIALLIACWVTANQIHLLQTKESGLPDKQLIRLFHTANLKEAESVFKKEVLQIKEVTDFAYVNQTPPAVDWSAVYRKDSLPQEYITNTIFAEQAVFKTLSLQFIEGTPFSDADTNLVVINQQAARKLNILNLKRDVWLHTVDSLPKNYKVVGMIKDFHFKPLKSNIEPLIIHTKTNPSWEAIIRIKEDADFELVNEKIKQVWLRFAGNIPYESFFVYNQFHESFEREEKIVWVLGIFSLLAFIIALLGLIGLVTYAIEQKSKATGIRLVLGAKPIQIVNLFLKAFTWQIVKAFAIAVPIAWYLEWNWIKTFPYQISFPILIFVVVGVGVFLIVALVVTAKVLPSVHKNPILLLRDE
ncbi:MAG: ABC transporter permease [Cyclobacteriaceae bacterium]|nr:ABC transporter permease [Cyclobacteriaceae bacterium]